MEKISTAERDLLRELARRVAGIAAKPVMEERRGLWRRHNALRPCRPMILIFPEGGWGELLPDSALECESEAARWPERALRTRIYYDEHFDDDTVITGDWVIHKAVGSTGWGLAAKQHEATEDRGAWRFNPVITGPEDLKKLRMPDVAHDEKKTEERLAFAQELFGDILDVRLKGVDHISYHLMAQYTKLRGLTETMLDMYENPGMLHDAMAFLTEGHERVLAQYVELNVLDVNNDNTYHSSGGNGWTDELPPPDFDPGRVRPCDMWGAAEAQELAQVGPEQHEEFSLAYERRLLAPFGLTGYGCCEDLTRKLDYVKRIPGIRRISMSPWIDIPACAEQLGPDYIFSWKPHPGHLVGEFDDDKVRGYIRDCLEVTLKAGCVVEMVLKDTHTCEHHPERFDRWTRIAREEVERAAGTLV